VDFDASRFETFWPEEIEEKGATKDGGNVDTDKDVEGSDADEVIVTDVSAGELFFHEVLLVDVVCKSSIVFSAASKGG
jgi:hypothetical protein